MPDRTLGNTRDPLLATTSLTDKVFQYWIEKEGGRSLFLISVVASPQTNPFMQIIGIQTVICNWLIRASIHPESSYKIRG